MQGHAGEQAGDVGAGDAALPAGEAAGHIDIWTGYVSTRGEAGGAGAGDRRAACGGSGGVGDDACEVLGLAVPVLKEPGVPGGTVVGGDLHGLAEVVIRGEVTGLQRELDVAGGTVGFDGIRGCKP